MSKDLNNLIEKCDKWINVKNPNNNVVQKLGITLHYSPTKEIWFFGYGKAGDYQAGSGKTPVEAILDKMKKDIIA